MMTMVMMMEKNISIISKKLIKQDSLFVYKNTLSTKSFLQKNPITENSFMRVGEYCLFFEILPDHYIYF